MAVQKKTARWNRYALAKEKTAFLVINSHLSAFRPFPSSTIFRQAV